MAAIQQATTTTAAVELPTPQARPDTAQTRNVLVQPRQGPTSRGEL